MKKLFVSVLLFLFLTPAFADDKDNAEDDVSFDEDKKQEDIKEKQEAKESVKARKNSYVRPKQEHIKLKDYAIQNLEKNKAQFEDRKRAELDNLRVEYSILEYSP